jgi:hypothetical protein
MSYIRCIGNRNRIYTKAKKLLFTRANEILEARECVLLSIYEKGRYRGLRR